MNTIRTRGELNKRFIVEPIQKQFCGVEFPRNHKFYETFNRKIQQLIEAGITEMLRKKYAKWTDPKYYERPRLTHKKYLVFVIWLGSLLLPLIGFLLEWLVKLKDFLIVKFVLTAFFEQKFLETKKDVGKRSEMVIGLKQRQTEERNRANISKNIHLVMEEIEKPADYIVEVDNEGMETFFINA
jgi:hypothetical protein